MRKPVSFQRSQDIPIWDEEDGQTGAILDTAQAEILLQTENGSVGDVGPVEEGQKVHDRQHGNDSQVDPGEELSFGNTCREHSCLAISIASSWVCQIRIVPVADAICVITVGMLGFFLCLLVSHPRRKTECRETILDPSILKRIVAASVACATKTRTVLGEVASRMFHTREKNEDFIQRVGSGASL